QRGSIYPEKKNGRVQDVHKKTGKRNFCIISFSENKHLLAGFVYFYFFKKKKKDTERNKKDAAGHPYFQLQVADPFKKFGKNITDQHQRHIAGKYTQHKSDTALVTTIE